MRNIIVIPKRKGPIKDPIPLDDGRFPNWNVQKKYKTFKREVNHERFGPPVMTPEKARGVYDVCQYMNSLQEITIAFKEKRRKFI